MINEAMGKILGMAMAYGVSSLGLLLAYYNYRKRIVKAERIFTPTAWTIIATILVVIAGAVWLVVMLARANAPEVAAGPAPAAQAAVPLEAAAGPAQPPAQAPVSRVTAPAWLGVVLPGVVFLFSLWVTWALYRHFAEKLKEGGTAGT